MHPLLLITLLFPADLTPSDLPGPQPSQELRYGDYRARATRLPRRPDLPYQPIVLRFDDLEIEVEAGIDPFAIVAIEPDADEMLLHHGLRPVRPLMRSAGLWLVSSDGDDGLDIAARLSNELDVTPNLWLRHTVHTAPNDPRFPGQWYFERINMLDAWELTKGDPARTIVIIDNGCDLEHPDLAEKMMPGLDVVDNDDDPSYEPNSTSNEHGTACAGIAAAVTDNARGIAGGCPECGLRCVRLLSNSGTLVPLSADVEAFEYALAVDADVISNSWGFIDQIPVPPALETAINNVYENGRGGKGALVLFAAGNESREIEDHELLAVEGVLGIGAINNYDEKTSFTNTGNSVDLVAPAGTNTTDISGPDGDDPGDYTTSFGGTSSACPVAAGVAGLLVSGAPEKTSAELYEVLIETARPAPYAEVVDGHDLIYGWGIIDPTAALTALGVTPTPTGTPKKGCDCAATASPLWLVALLLRRRKRAP